MRKYINPQLEVVELEKTDIITMQKYIVLMAQEGCLHYTFQKRP